MLLLKYVLVLAGLGVLAVVAGLVLYDACLEVNFQRRVARRRAANLLSPGPVACRPAVFLYQRGLAERQARPAAELAPRIRRRAAARRWAATS